MADSLLNLALSSKALITIGVLLAAFALWYQLRGQRSATLLNRFGLSPIQWMVIGDDLGKSGSPFHVKGYGLCGTPDLVARHRRQKVIKLFDYKHRKYRNEVRTYERYQVILYAGVMQLMFKDWTILAAIKYKDAIVDVPVDPRVFDFLLTYRDNVRPYL